MVLELHVFTNSSSFYAEVRNPESSQVLASVYAELELEELLSVFNRELIAIAKSVYHFAGIFPGQQFLVFSDCVVHQYMSAGAV
jgi:hypothetical protein